MRGAERQDSARAALDSPAPMGTLIIARHSITEASAAGRNLGQRSDPPLAADGLALAARLGDTLRAELDELPHDDLRLLSSPALRCRQTAGEVVDAIGAHLEMEVHEGLLELDYGAWDGLTADECRARDPEQRAAWEADPFATRCPEGESGQDVFATGLGRPRSGRGLARRGPGALRDRDRPQPRQPPAPLRAVRLADARVPRPAVAGSGGVQHRRAQRRDARRPSRERGAGDATLSRRPQVAPRGPSGHRPYNRGPHTDEVRCRSRSASSSSR